MSIAPLPPFLKGGVQPPRRASEPYLSAPGGASTSSYGKFGSANTAPSFWSRLSRAGTSFFGGLSQMFRGVGLNIYEGVSTIGSGLSDLFQGSFGSGLLSIASGLVKTVIQTPLDALIMGGGSLLSGIQTTFSYEPLGRKLSNNEIFELSRVYGDSLDYDKVIVKEGEVGLFGLPERAFTLGNTIFVPPNYLVNSHVALNTLVHEMAHVWQHQTGGTDYLSEALWAQYFGDGYDYSLGISHGKQFADLNPEQQAQLIEKAYANHFFEQPSTPWIDDGKDMSSYMQRTWTSILSGVGAT